MYQTPPHNAETEFNNKTARNMLSFASTDSPSLGTLVIGMASKPSNELTKLNSATTTVMYRPDLNLSRIFLDMLEECISPGSRKVNLKDVLTACSSQILVVCQITGLLWLNRRVPPPPTSFFSDQISYRDTNGIVKDISGKSLFGSGMGRGGGTEERWCQESISC